MSRETPVGAKIKVGGISSPNLLQDWEKLKTKQNTKTTKKAFPLKEDILGKKFAFRGNTSLLALQLSASRRDEPFGFWTVWFSKLKTHEIKAMALQP